MTSPWLSKASIFPPQPFILLGGFLLIYLPLSHALRVEFFKLPNCLYLTCVRSYLGFFSWTLQGAGFPPQFHVELRGFLLSGAYQTIILIFRFFLLNSLLSCKVFFLALTIFYDQDKPKGSNSFIVSSIYAKTKDQSRGPILVGCRKINSRVILDSIC